MGNKLDKLVISVDEQAEEWQVTARTIRNWCENGTIIAKKLSREWAILRGQEKPVLKSGPKQK